MNCVMCKGLIDNSVINHVVDMDGHITIIKNVPAKVCRQCGESYIDHEVALKIEEILDKYANSNVEVLIISYLDKVA